MTIPPLTSGKHVCGGCGERIFADRRDGRFVWKLVLVLQADTTVCYPNSQMIEDPGLHHPDPPLTYKECSAIAAGDPVLLEWLEQPERDRLAPQGCKECGTEVDADGVPPEHFDWCSTLRK